MAKKKKGGGKKGNKSAGSASTVSPEDAAAQQDKRDEAMKLLLQDRVTQEEEISKLNTIKVENEWRQIMRNEKAAGLKRELDFVRLSFSRDIDAKDAFIRALLTDLRESEEQYQRAMKSHGETMDRLQKLQAQRLNDLGVSGNQQLAILKKEFMTERQEILTRKKNEVQKLQDIIYAMDHEFNEQEGEMMQEFTSVHDELKNKNLEEKHALRIMLEGHVEGLFKEFQNALNEYNHNTEEKKAEFERLKKRDKASAKTIDQQMRKLQRLQDSVVNLKVRMQNSTRDSEKDNRVIKEQKETIGAHFHELKGRMNRYRDNQAQSLTELTLKSNEAVKKLDEQQNLAERILKLAEMNRKLETEDEKVFPFYDDLELDEDGNDVPRPGKETVTVAQKVELHPDVAQKNRHYAIGFADSGQPLDEYMALDLYWKKYNAVLLDKLALEKRYNERNEENHKLRSILKQYLDGISVSEEVIAEDDNPLFRIRAVGYHS